MRKTSRKKITNEEKTIRRMDRIFREILLTLNDLENRVTALEDTHKVITLTADEVTKIDKSELLRTPQEDRPPVRPYKSPYTQEYKG